MNNWQEEVIQTPSLKRFSKVHLVDISESSVPLLLCRRGDCEYPVMDSVFPGMDYVVHCCIAPDGMPICMGSMSGSPNVVIQHGAKRKRFPYDCEEEPSTLLFLGSKAVFIAEIDSCHGGQKVLIRGNRVVAMADFIDALSIQDNELCYAREDDDIYKLVCGEHSCRLGNGDPFGKILLFHSVMLCKPKNQDSFNKWICCFQLEEGGHYFVVSGDSVGPGTRWTLEAGGHGITIQGLTILDDKLFYLETDSRKKPWVTATLVWGEKRMSLDDKFSFPDIGIEKFAIFDNKPLLLVKKNRGKSYYVCMGIEESPEYDFILPKSLHFDPKKRIVSFIARFDKSIYRVSRHLP